MSAAKHTPGVWVAEHVGSTGNDDNPMDIYEVNNGRVRIAEYVCEADARLIAAAPDGLKAAEIAYLAMLKIPHVDWRFRHQMAYCALRDFIAKATGRDSQEVQDEYEAKATGADK